MTAKNFEVWYKYHNACQEGVDFAKGKTLTKVWKTCQRPDWMMWIYERANPSKKIAVKVAIFAAEKVLHLFEEKYPNDDRPRKAIEAAKEWLKHPLAASAASAESAALAAWAASAASAASAESAAWAAWAEINKDLSDYIRKLIPMPKIKEVSK